MKQLLFVTLFVISLATASMARMEDHAPTPNDRHVNRHEHGELRDHYADQVDPTVEHTEATNRRSTDKQLQDGHAAIVISRANEHNIYAAKVEIHAGRATAEVWTAISEDHEV